MSTLKIKRYHISLVLFIITILALNAYWLEIFGDMKIYNRYYYSMINYEGLIFRYEVLFSLITYLGGFLNSFKLFYFIVSLFITISMYFFIVRLSCLFNLNAKKVKLLIILSLVLMICSPFYWSGITVVIRNMCAVPLLFLSLYFFYIRKWKISLSFFGMALFFHYTTILYALFFLIFFIRKKVVFLSYIFLTIIYFTQVFENYILSILKHTEVITNDYLTYLQDTEIHFDFWLFSSLFYFLTYYISNKNKNIEFLFYSYSVLFFPFLFFGFIDYADRLLLPLWIFISFISATFIVLSLNTTNLSFIKETTMKNGKNK